MKLQIKELERNKVVESIVRFGSSIQKKNYRDIDLCVFTSKKINLKQKLKFVRDFPEKYDICFYDDLPINLKKEVLSKGKIVFTKNYFKILQQIKYIDLEYPRYARFLKDYHKKRMKAL